MDFILNRFSKPQGETRHAWVPRHAQDRAERAAMASSAAAQFNP